MKNKTFKKCKKCGSTQFIVTESLCHKAEMINGTLEVGKNFKNEINSIACEKCGEVIETKDQDFEISFNW
ncbi:MAG: hypothetical protein ACP6IY_19525 [Promethearchaeia archaeon]